MLCSMGVDQTLPYLAKPSGRPSALREAHVCSVIEIAN